MRRLFWLFLLLVPLSVMAANRLATAESPYLRMHAENPVDWYPWGDEAFEQARREGKPVFLSIGYSSCYWCRVAEETLYRDPVIAARMNAGFINIKVDREQRPDLDRLYMAATRLLGGSGGWPNNLFLTPERKPFFAGSYFPPADDDLGRTGFPRILARIEEAWAKRRDEIDATAERVAMTMRAAPPAPSVAVEPARWRREARATLLKRADPEHGGLKGRGVEDVAKFPMVPELSLLAGHAAGQRVVRQALDAMAASTLHDHLGGGFYRYTVDSRWNQPHFEKMLYDNAQLLRLYAVAGHKQMHREVALRTADFLLRELQAPQGGFYASFDAVSAGREGLFYLWDEDEIRTVLGAAAGHFLAAYQVMPLPGHLDDPHEDFDRDRGPLRLREKAAGTNRLTEARASLWQHRARRPAPARDDKIILAWNGLAIEALAVAGEKLRAPHLTDAARKAADRLWRDAWEPATGRLRQALFEGRAQGEGFLEDYALFGLGLLAVGQHERAVSLADALIARFSRADGGLAETVHAPELFASAPETGDGPYPAGASAAWRLLDRLAQREPRFRPRADGLLASLAPLIARAPDRWPVLLAGLPDRAALPIADPAAGSAGVVTATARWQGRRLLVTLAIAPGWHVNANPASFDYLIPTRIEFNGVQALGVRYPAAERFRAGFAKADLAVYAGQAVIAAEFGDRRPTAASVTVQACSDAICLPPAGLDLLLR